MGQRESVIFTYINGTSCLLHYMTTIYMLHTYYHIYKCVFAYACTQQATIMYPICVGYKYGNNESVYFDTLSTTDQQLGVYVIVQKNSVSYQYI